MTKEPGSLDVGSIYDDYADLVRIASGEQTVLAAHLVPLASVLDAVGTLLAPRLAARGG